MNIILSTCLALKNSSDFISARQMGSAFQLSISPASLFPSLPTSHKAFFLYCFYPFFYLIPIPPPKIRSFPSLGGKRIFVFFLFLPRIPVSFFFFCQPYICLQNYSFWKEGKKETGESGFGTQVRVQCKSLSLVNVESEENENKPRTECKQTTAVTQSHVEMHIHTWGGGGVEGRMEK